MSENQIMDANSVVRTLKRLSYEILEKNQDHENLVIIGIQRRGVYLAERIVNNIKKNEGVDIPYGVMDITLYRDDLTAASPAPIVGETRIDFDVNNKTVILVDDVLYTGRTVRCALSEIMDFGRPRRIELCVLVDRGHRELPIKADFVGKNIPTAEEEIVDVNVKEIDGIDNVVLLRKE